MSVRIGVDVGGTFTKAVGVDTATGAIAAQASVFTTHDDPAGAAAGVVRVIHDVAESVGVDAVGLITYSTTQAVNALLESDVAVVGVLGLGREPDLRKASKRTRLDCVEVSPGRRLPTVSEFIDVSRGLDAATLDAAIDRLEAAGATTICVAEAFAPDGGDDERRAVQAAQQRGFPACGSAEMTGLYGLELRAITACLNASVLPIAIRTEEHVERGVAAAGITAPVMVMRGDGGATNPAGLRREPARALYSGPAASVAGVLRRSAVADGIVVEVGGTSTNVAAIRHGRPKLSYVQVASHATAVRALDVRVIGVAGGSMVRVRRGRLYGIGPRSAHIAQLPYACYLEEHALVGATAEQFAPRPGDPADYLALRLVDGTRAALTNTCAAVALDVVQPDDHAARDASRGAAKRAFAIASESASVDGDTLAQMVLQTSAQAVATLVVAAAAEHGLTNPTLVAIGGGAGGLGRYTATILGLDCEVPEHAEIISAIGDALSFVRIERERSITAETASVTYGEIASDAEQDCIASGADPLTVDVRVELADDTNTMRAVATGTVGDDSASMPGRDRISLGDATAIARRYGMPPPIEVGESWLSATDHDAPSVAPIMLIDRNGDPIAYGDGLVARIDADDEFTRAAQCRIVTDHVKQCTRRKGPVIVAPTIWIVAANRSLQIRPQDSEMIASLVPPNLGPAVAVTMTS